MRVIVAGASGALGRVLVPELVGSGHEVIGLTRTAEGAARVRSAGGSLWSPTSWIATPCCARQQASGRMRSSTSSRRCWGKVAPYGAAVLGTVSMGVSDAAKRDLGWAPRYPDYLAGLG